MCKISKEAYEECKIEIIDDKKYFCINKRDLEIGSDYKNWTVIFDKCDPKKQKYRQELIANTQFQPCRVFVRNDLVERKIRSRRVSSKNFLEFEGKLGLDPNEYIYDDQDIISALQVVFEGETMHTQYFIQSKRLDLYFALLYFDFEYKKSRQLIIEEKLGCKIISSDADAPDFNIYRPINQVPIKAEQSTIK